MCREYSSYTLQVSATTSLTWTTWLTSPATGATFTSLPGQSYAFRLRAVDPLGNQSDWTLPASTTIAAVTKYYALGGQKVALRRGGVVYFIHGDDPSALLRTSLGSTSLTTGENGAVVSEVRYLPYGQERWASGGAAVTDFGFTSQRVERGFGLMDYNARYYSASLGRFVSPDTIVPEPGGSQGWNRYAYTFNNPLKYVDSSGHCPPSICQDEWGRPVDEYYRYGDRAVMDSLPLSGLNPWYPVDVVPPPYLPPGPVPDGISARVSVSPAEVVPIGMGTVGGFELVHNYDSGDTTLFGIVGAEVHITGGATKDLIAISDIYNIGDNNLNYSGAFRSVDVTGAYVLGGGAGYAWVPYQKEENLPYSLAGEIVMGVGGRVQFSETEYIPLFTVTSNLELKPHPNDYLQNSASQELTLDYYKMLNEHLQSYKAK